MWAAPSIPWDKTPDKIKRRKLVEYQHSSLSASGLWKWHNQLLYSICHHAFPTYMDWTLELWAKKMKKKRKTHPSLSCLFQKFCYSNKNNNLIHSPEQCLINQKGLSTITASQSIRKQPHFLILAFSPINLNRWLFEFFLWQGNKGC